ncbi:MAG: nucleotidyltransferase domain-containing protein [Candidatus Omnitrophica bacterium]|nr:nucleotidyltransferase domain-containing protein [Candidatus Omnitrophota bacterium]
MNEREKQIIKQAIGILKDCLNPSRIILFGSRAKGNTNEYADFDFGVDCLRPGISLQREINEAIEKISGLYKVDVVYIPSVDKEFKNIIIKTGKVVYERGD